MRVLITRNTFQLGKKTPDVLLKGRIYDLTDEAAKALIASKKANAYAEPKADNKSDEKVEKPKKSKE